MLTDLGKLLRKLRIDRDERLLDMSEKTGHSVSFLSAVETGKKSPPAGFEERIIGAYQVEAKMAEEIRAAADKLRTAFLIEPKSSREHEVSALFARRINDLTQSEMDDIKRILAGGPKKE